MKYFLNRPGALFPLPIFNHHLSPYGGYITIYKYLQQSTIISLQLLTNIRSSATLTIALNVIVNVNNMLVVRNPIPSKGWACRDGVALHLSSLSAHLTRPGQGIQIGYNQSGYRATISASVQVHTSGALPAHCSVTPGLTRCTRVKSVLRRSADRYLRQGEHYFVRERVPAISGNVAQTALLLCPRRGETFEIYTYHQYILYFSCTNIFIFMNVSIRESIYDRCIQIIKYIDNQ